jgi:polysaccharide export outer membrane protein
MRSISLHGRAAAWIVVLMACAGLARGQALPQAPEPAELHTQPSVNYRMLPRDTVHIKVFQEDDLETTARIDNDGNIFFPLLGKAKIGGQTIQEATATMQRLLREYLINPQVSVEIVSYTKQHFTILGQVNRPGIFDIPDEGSLNLLEALGTAGGYTKIADPHHVIIKRMVNGQETIIPVDAKKLLDRKNTSEPIPEILPGDTISVAESMF